MNFRVRPKSTLPKCEVPPPKQRHCAIPDCGEPIGIDHVVCGAHWAKLPFPIRGMSNRYRRRFAGDEYYDRFIADMLIPSYEARLAGRMDVFGIAIPENSPEDAA